MSLSIVLIQTRICKLAACQRTTANRIFFTRSVCLFHTKLSSCFFSSVRNRTNLFFRSHGHRCCLPHSTSEGNGTLKLELGWNVVIGSDLTGNTLLRAISRSNFQRSSSISASELQLSVAIGVLRSRVARALGYNVHLRFAPLRS